jgi:hypothetical protein
MRTTDIAHPEVRHRVEELQQISGLPAPDFEPEDMVAALTVAYYARKGWGGVTQDEFENVKDVLRQAGVAV